MQRLILLRHGESVWNLENRFTGWADVDLSETGIAQARNAGALLKKNGFVFDIAFTSVLKRAIKTLDIALEELDQLWVPVEKTWRLNERFYGALQGLNKAETAHKYGDEQVHKWRREPSEHPPAINTDDTRYPGFDIRYKALTISEIPLTENLSETMARVLPFWKEKIAPAILENEQVIVCAHGNSLRALVQYIDHLSDEDVSNLDIPTGTPLVYELSDRMESIRHYYLQ